MHFNINIHLKDYDRYGYHSLIVFDMELLICGIMKTLECYPDVDVSNVSVIANTGYVDLSSSLPCCVVVWTVPVQGPSDHLPNVDTRVPERLLTERSGGNFVCQKDMVSARQEA